MLTVDKLSPIEPSPQAGRGLPNPYAGGRLPNPTAGTRHPNATVAPQHPAPQCGRRRSHSRAARQSRR